MKKLLTVIALFVSTSASAQQQPPEPAFLQRALVAMQTQRNQALDAAAIQQARADGLADDLAKAQARIKELEQKPEEKPAKN